MIIYLCSVAFAFICGAVGGALLYRNNVAKADKVVDTVKADAAKVGKAIDELKK